MPRVIVVANKEWEAGPLCAVLASNKACPPGITLRPTGQRGLRGTLAVGSMAVEVWCLQDLLDPDDASRSDKKWDALNERVFPGEPGALVVAFGTAATRTPQNGSVVLGTRIFAHDPRSPGSPSHWTHPSIGTVVASPLGERLFAELTSDPSFRPRAECRFLEPPIHPADPPVVLASAAYVALGDVNVVNYGDYAWADAETVAAFEEADPRASFGSLETTHGLIRLASDAPFLFASGITDRVGHFNEEVAPREYAQNFAAAHNAAVTLAHMLPALATL